MAKEHLKYESTEIDRRLDLAGTALQEHQDISHLATKDEVVDGLATKENVIEDLAEIRSGAALGATAIQEHQDISNLATKKEVSDGLAKKVDKVSGKQLSTEDFTSALKTKLEGLSNYDDTKLSNALNTLRSDFDKLVNGDTTTAIKTFNEVIAFLDGIKDTENLDRIIASIESQIAAKQDVINDLATIREGASKGATAIQEVKTINGESILGKGNIEIKGGGGGSADIPQDLMDIINSLYLSEMNEDFNNDFAI